MKMDPKRLSLAKATRVPKGPSTPKAPRHGAGEKFLRGPIPWSWLMAAAKASGRGSALKVALALWHLSGLNRQQSTLELGSRILRELGVERHAAYRGLADLEASGLVSVERHSGRRTRVTLLDAPQEDANES